MAITQEEFNTLENLSKQILKDLSTCNKILKKADEAVADLWTCYGRQTQTKYIKEIRESSDEMSLEEAVRMIKKYIKT